MANYKELEWLDERRRFRKVGRFKKFGVKKSSGDLLTKIKYTKISPFVDGIAVVEYQRFFFKQTILGIVTTDGKEVLFDKNCKKVVVLNKNVIAVKIEVEEETYEWAIFNSEGIEPYGFRYEVCPTEFVNGFSQVKHKGKYNFINEMGKQLGVASYTRVANFRKNGKAYVWVGNTRYVLRKDGVRE